MTQLPLISVIVPVYKVENYLDCCVQSIVNQTYSNLEIILIDDGSPDASGAMCDAWAEKDSRIRVIHQENAGGGAARNAGLDAARGERIAFVDSDDYIAPGCYQYLHTLLEEGADIAECDFVETERNDAVFGTDAGEISFYTPLEAMRCHIRDTAFRQLIWNKLYRRAIFAQLRYPEGKLNEDIAGSLQNQITEVDERLAALEHMTLKNLFTVPVAIDNTGTTLLADDLGNAIVADWKYKEE